MVHLLVFQSQFAGQKMKSARSAKWKWTKEVLFFYFEKTHWKQKQPNYIFTLKENESEQLILCLCKILPK